MHIHLPKEWKRHAQKVRSYKGRNAVKEKGELLLISPEAKLLTFCALCTRVRDPVVPAILPAKPGHYFGDRVRSVLAPKVRASPEAKALALMRAHSAHVLRRHAPHGRTEAAMMPTVLRFRQIAFQESQKRRSPQQGR